MSGNKILLLAAISAAGWLLPGTASATSLSPLTIEQMTDASELIVHGVVNEVWVEHDDRGNLWTRANVEITGTLKGDTSVDAVTIDQLGGILHDEFQLIASVPRFSPGEEGLFFLEVLGSGRTSVVGWQQGKFTSRIDPDTGERIAVQFTVPYTKAYDHRFIPHPNPEDRVLMDDLDDRVLSRVAAGWDGLPIPGADPAKLARINTVQQGVTK